MTRRYATLGAALLAAACAALPPPISLDGLPAAFEMRGRMSVAQAGHGEIVRLRWEHAPSAGVWVLTTPVGTEVARIERAGTQVTILRPGAPPQSAESFAAFTASLLGVALDERLLVAWLHGRALAGPEDWSVTIEESQRFGSSEVARRISASRDGTELKLIVDHYRARPD